MSNLHRTKKPFVLTDMGLALSQAHGNQRCHRCTLAFVAGDKIIRVKSRRTKWYHKGCFKEIA